MYKRQHEIQKVECLDYEDLKKLVDWGELDKFRRNALNPEHPVLRTTGQYSDTYFQSREAVSYTHLTFTYFGGFIPGIPIPTPFFLAVVCVVITMLVLKFTNLGLYTQAVGINASSSRLNGLNPVSYTHLDVYKRQILA